jgi:hypothetical protein
MFQNRKQYSLSFSDLSNLITNIYIDISAFNGSSFSGLKANEMTSHVGKFVCLDYLDPSSRP